MAKEIEVKGLKEINDLFSQLPKQVKRTNIWTAFWRKNSKPFITQAQSNLNSLKGQKDKATPKRTGRLKESIGFFTTKSSRKYLGGYVGPRVKGTFKGKGKSGYYGAWIEYGGEVKFGGKGFGINQEFMKPSWDGAKAQVLQNSFKDAEEVMAKAIKRHEKRLQKYGKYGY